MTWITFTAAGMKKAWMWRGGETIELLMYRLINFIMKMNESHLKLEFYLLLSGASSCNLKCALGYRDVVMLSIIHDSLAEPQTAKMHTILDFSMVTKFSHLFALKTQASPISQQMSPKEFLFLQLKSYSSPTLKSVVQVQSLQNNWEVLPEPRKPPVSHTEM